MCVGIHPSSCTAPHGSQRTQAQAAQDLRPHHTSPESHPLSAVWRQMGAESSGQQTRLIRDAAAERGVRGLSLL